MLALGLFSLVTLFAQQLLGEQTMPLRQSAWYSKPFPTFIDTHAFVRQHLWPISLSSLSSAKPDMVEIPRVLRDRLTVALSLAAPLIWNSFFSCGLSSRRRACTHLPLDCLACYGT